MHLAIRCTGSVLQQPRLRLRHLQGVALHTFSPPQQLPRHAQLFYELSLLPAGGDGQQQQQQQQQLVYVSEQVRRQLCDGTVVGR
jgi:hypothetical protein